MSMYYDVNRTISKQRLFNFVIGARGCGKTYGAKDYCIKRFLKYGKQFVYLRRYDTELPAAEIANFFDDIATEYPDHEFKSQRGLFKIDGNIAGWYFPLSKAIMLKSIPFPHVGLIVFDEFIIETGLHRYLNNEVRAFLECYSTISRDRDVPVLFISNAITMSNPYFLYFDIKFEPGNNLFLTPFISAELIQNEEYEEHVNNTKFGQLISTTQYGQYAIQNRFLLDTETFIEKMPPESNYICTFNFSGDEMGYYVNNNCGKWYLSAKVDKTCPRKFTLDVLQHTDETILAAKNNLYLSGMINKFCMGLLRFDTQRIKAAASAIIKRMM